MNRSDSGAEGEQLSDRLGGAVRRRPLHFIFVLDVSGSMLREGRIQALNNAIAEVIPHLRDEARLNPHAQLFVRVLAFASEVDWVVAEPTPIEQFHWQRVAATPRGFTELGRALQVLAGTMLELEHTQGGGYPPAIILVSDGRPTEASGVGFAQGLGEFLATRWGAASVRLALGVGRDADLGSMRRFIGNDTIPLLRADSPEQLVDYIVWASKAASRGASMPTVGQDPTATYAPPPSDGSNTVWGTR